MIYFPSDVDGCQEAPASLATPLYTSHSQPCITIALLFKPMLRCEAEKGASTRLFSLIGEVSVINKVLMVGLPLHTSIYLLLTAVVLGIFNASDFMMYLPALYANEPEQ